MRILFITDNFPPETNAPASRTFEHCRAWARAGHDVTVITCAPNFPTGKVFAGYRNRLWQREHIDGINVIRVWSYITANDGFALRIADYLSFMVSAMIATLFVRKPGVVLATSPQLFTLVAGRWASFVRRVPWILELRDIWPESIKAVGAMRDSLAIRLLERLELSLYRSADRIVAVTKSFEQRLAERGIDTTKIDVITNGVDLGRYTPRRSVELRERLGWKDKFVVGYLGTHGMAHALETILDAAVLARGRQDCSNILFALVGDGARKDALVSDARDRGLQNVAFLSSVPKDAVADHWGALDAAIVHLRQSELFRSVIPSKIFESMAMGVPILMGVEGEARDIVMNAGAGIAFAPESAHGLLDAILTIQSDASLRNALSQNAIKAAPQFDRGRLAAEFLKVIQRVRR